MSSFWCSLFDKRLHPLGRCKDHTNLLPPPAALLSSDEDSKRIQSMIELLPKLKGIPHEAFSKETIKNYSRIKKGNIFEVMSLNNPFCGWFVKVLQNIGGRLFLEYISPMTETTGLHIWLFHTDKRIKHIGWINDCGGKYRYDPPSKLLLDDSIDSDWIENLRIKSPLVTPCLHVDTVSMKHNVSLGQRFEYVNPKTRGVINEVVVSEIHDAYFFSVACSEFVVLTSFDDWFLLPRNFCSSNSLPVTSHGDFSEDFNSNHSCINDETEKRRQLSSILIAKEKLEVVHPTNEEVICVATITKITGHLMWLKLDSEQEFPPFIKTLVSTDIFAAEWASDNSHPIVTPSWKRTKTEKVLTSQVEIENIVEEKKTWCDGIYVNPWCVTGPLINKKKLAHIPQLVGPGPLKLVLLRTLTFFFNSAYRPNRVLTEVDALLKKKLYWPKIFLKARYKQRIVRSTFNIPPFLSMVKSFLGEICEILECCPNLWTINAPVEDCQFGCPKKSEYLDNIYQLANQKLFSGKRHRVCKTLLCSDKQTERSPEADDEGIDMESVDSFSDGSDSSRTISQQGSPSQSPSPSPREVRDENIRRQIASLDPNGLGVWDVESNPETWSIDDLAQYLSGQPDIGHLVPLLRSQDFDGASFLLLNLPSILHDLHIPYNFGLKLAHCVFRLKLACLIFDKEGELRHL